jgi:hypothetical protein
LKHLQVMHQQRGSRPRSCGRGLKRLHAGRKVGLQSFASMGTRGLKFPNPALARLVPSRVHAGSWIEIPMSRLRSRQVPFASARGRVD